MTKELEKLRDVFLNSELDNETIEDNKKKIAEWEKSLLFNESLAEWQDHDITRKIIRKAKLAYKDNGLFLAESRELSEAQRQSLFAKQDAIIFLISLTGDDAQKEIEQINNEIRIALKAT